MTHTINTAGSVAVATDYFWQPIDADTPKGVKLLREQVISPPQPIDTGSKSR